MTAWHILSFSLGWLTCCGVLYARGWWAERKAMHLRVALVQELLDQGVVRPSDEALAARAWKSIDQNRMHNDAFYSGRECPCDRCSGRRARA